MKNNPDSEEHIRRIDVGSKTKGQTRGFQVHFARGGRVWTKFFSDSKCGSKEKARKAARKFRGAMLKKLPETQSIGAVREGARGYSIRKRKNRDGSVTRYVSASIAFEKGKSMRKAFRIETKVGDAIKAALNWRSSMVRKRVKAEKA